MGPRSPSMQVTRSDILDSLAVLQDASAPMLSSWHGDASQHLETAPGVTLGEFVRTAAPPSPASKLSGGLGEYEFVNAPEAEQRPVSPYPALGAAARHDRGEDDWELVDDDDHQTQGTKSYLAAAAAAPARAPRAARAKHPTVARPQYRPSAARLAAAAAAWDPEASTDFQAEDGCDVDYAVPEAESARHRTWLHRGRDAAILAGRETRRAETATAVASRPARHPRDATQLEERAARRAAASLAREQKSKERRAISKHKSMKAQANNHAQTAQDQPLCYSAVRGYKQLGLALRLRGRSGDHPNRVLAKCANRSDWRHAVKEQEAWLVSTHKQRCGWHYGASRVSSKHTGFVSKQ